MSKKITTLYEDKELQNELYPRTKVEAITNNSNASLQSLLDNKQNKVTNATDKLASFNSSGQIENSTIDKSDVEDVIDDYKTESSLKSNQTFLYRQSPTTVDGSAKITKIKGNTLVWNQLARPLESEYWNTNNSSVSYSNNVALCTCTDSGAFGLYRRVAANPISSINGHNYLFCVTINSSKTGTFRVGFNQANLDFEVNSANNDISSAIVYQSDGTDSTFIIYKRSNTSVGDTFSVKNLMMVDLTQLNNSAITDATSFRQYYPLPYYDYCQGSLISFGSRMVNFNQLVEHKMATATQYGVTFTNNGDGSFTLNGTAAADATFRVDQSTYGDADNLKTYQAHKYYIYNGSLQTRTIVMQNSTWATAMNCNYEISKIANVNNTIDNCFIFVGVKSGTVFNNLKVRPQIFDLTQMFGAGNEPTSVETVEALLSNDYYEYTTGTPMNIVSDVGIETTGKNLAQKLANNLNINSSGQFVYDSAFCLYYAKVIKGKNYFVTTEDATATQTVYCFCYEKPTTSSVSYDETRHVTQTRQVTAEIDGYLVFRSYMSFSKVQCEIGTSSSEYEPYTENTLSLPISQYFPEGEMSAGDIYDELTENNYIKRVGMIDLGILPWRWQNEANHIFAALVPGRAYSGIRNRLSCSKYMPEQPSSIANMSNGCIAGSNSDINIYIRDTNYSDVSLFKNAVSGIMVQYELANPLINYGIVNLSSLDWHYSNNATRFYCDVSSLGIKPTSGVGVPINGICSAYRVLAYNQVTSNTNSKSLGVNTSLNDMNIYDTDYTDVDTFKLAMSNVYLYYELATPTEDLILGESGYNDLANEIIYPCYIGGTEQILPENTSVPVTAPIIADIEYNNTAQARLDIVDKVPEVIDKVVDNINGLEEDISDLTGSVTDLGDDLTALGNSVSNVVNTGDSDTPVQGGTTKFTTGGAYTLQTSINNKASLASPAFTGTPTAPTPSTSSNNTQIATTAFVKAQPTILYGTSVPSSSTGKDGDIFILYS